MIRISSKEGVKYDDDQFFEIDDNLWYIGEETDGNKINIPEVKYASCMFLNNTTLKKAPTELPPTIEVADRMFEGTNIRFPPRVLPNSLVLANRMFKNCRWMLIAPHEPLPELTSAEEMFAGCSAILKPPILPERGINYAPSMFKGCRSLLTLPELGPECRYINNIFEGCSAVKHTVKLPEGVLDYYDMYKDCINIKFSLIYIPGEYGL